MKRRFVLDENTVICAQRGCDPYGVRDSSYLDLLISIERNCHALVMLEAFFGIYISQLSGSIGHAPHDPRVLVVLKTLLGNMDKDHHFVHEGEIVKIEGLEQIAHVDRGDRQFVVAAASSPGSILVTDDLPLAEALEANGIPARFGFTVLTAREALPIADPTD